MYCFVILLLFNEMQMSVRRFSAIPHLRAPGSVPRMANSEFALEAPAGCREETRIYTSLWTFERIIKAVIQMVKAK